MSLTRDTLTECLHCGKEIRCGCVITYLCDECEAAGHTEQFPTACPKCNESFQHIEQVVEGSRTYWKDRAEKAEHQLAEARAQLTNLRVIGGKLRLNLDDAAVFYPDHFSADAVKQLLAEWDEAVDKAVRAEMKHERKALEPK